MAEIKLEVLYRNYQHNGKNIRSDISPSLIPFKQEVRAVLSRYKHHNAQERKTNIQNQWTARPGLVDAMRACYIMSKKLFASPLNHNLKLNVFHSLHARDHVWGHVQRLLFKIPRLRFI